MKPIQCFLAFALIAAAVPAWATTFVVPPDEELVEKADAIILGEVIDEGTVERDGDEIFTVFHVQILQKLKGGVQKDELLRVYRLGGVTPDGGVVVNGVAEFKRGEVALIFLSRDKDRRWRTTELALGKFRRSLGAAGERVLTRDLDDAAVFDANGRPHQDKARKEKEFLEFIAARVRGERPNASYFLSSSPLKAEPTGTTSSPVTLDPAANATYPPGTYTSNIGSCSGCADAKPTRWTDASMSAGVPFHKRAGYNITGASDGGAGAIRSGLAAWTNDCGSNVNLVYGGETSTASKNFDSVHVVEFNDPQGRVPGSWSGSGTIAITFNSFGNQHTFQGSTWWSITDADVVFQDGYPATNAAFATAMTHELGHGIGWRHSNEHFTGGACNSAIEECTSAAIMNSSAVSSYGYNLQQWDINAVRSVYPGGSCTAPPPACSAPAITQQPVSTTITSGNSALLTVAATGTAPLAYQWYAGSSGSLGSPITGATGPTLTVSPTANASYWVRVSNSCGSVNSATVVVSVTAAAPTAPTKFNVLTPCRIVDTRGSAALGGGRTLTINTAARCGVPSGAAAISVNITAVTPAAAGFLTAYPGRGGPPAASSISFRAGKTIAAGSIVRLSGDEFSVYNGSAAPVHFLVDVNGYFR